MNWDWVDWDNLYDNCEADGEGERNAMLRAAFKYGYEARKRRETAAMYGAAPREPVKAEPVASATGACLQCGTLAPFHQPYCPALAAQYAATPYAAQEDKQ